MEDPIAIGRLFSERESDSLAILRTRQFIGVVAGADGVYTCFANNSIETTETSVTVSVQG